jgi:hypothetical protein
LTGHVRSYGPIIAANSTVRKSTSYSARSGNHPWTQQCIRYMMAMVLPHLTSVNRHKTLLPPATARHGNAAQHPIAHGPPLRIHSPGRGRRAAVRLRLLRRGQSLQEMHIQRRKARKRLLCWHLRLEEFWKKGKWSSSSSSASLERRS